MPRQAPSPIPDDYAAAQKRAHEIESFGLFGQPPPPDPLSPPDRTAETGSRLPDASVSPASASRWSGVLITEKSAETKHGQAMEFITLEDVTALYDARCSPTFIAAAVTCSPQTVPTSSVAWWKKASASRH